MFKWRFLLRVAAVLLNAADQESECRSAINRAYYAAYGEARAFCEARGMILKKNRSSHEQVWQYLRSGETSDTVYGRAACKAIGDQGIFLRSQRVAADYFGNAAPPKSEAERAVATSREIIRRLHGLGN